MAIHTVTDGEGNVLQEWNDETRMYTDYRFEPPMVIGYTQEQNDQADALAAQEAADAEHVATTSRVKAIITELQAEKARVQPTIDASNATINANPAGFIKDNARAAKRIADAAIDLAKYIDGR